MIPGLVPHIGSPSRLAWQDAGSCKIERVDGRTRPERLGSSIDLIEPCCDCSGGLLTTERIENVVVYQVRLTRGCGPKQLK